MKECKRTWCDRNCQQHPAMKRWGEKCMVSSLPCKMVDIATHANVINVLDRPLKEGEQYVCMLTKDEVCYCLAKEKRRGGIARLEGRKRELLQEEGGWKRARISEKGSA